MTSCGIKIMMLLFHHHVYFTIAVCYCILTVIILQEISGHSQTIMTTPPSKRLTHILWWSCRKAMYSKMNTRTSCGKWRVDFWSHPFSLILLLIRYDVKPFIPVLQLSVCFGDRTMGGDTGAWQMPRRHWHLVKWYHPHKVVGYDYSCMVQL